MSVALLAIQLLAGSTVGLKVESIYSDVAEWPSPKLEHELMESLERTTKRQWAEHHMVFGEELRGDVAVSGKLEVQGTGVRFTWTLSTQDCPPMSDHVGFDFKTSTLSPISLDAMTVALAKRAAKLFEKARSQRAASCIDPSDLPPTEEELLRQLAEKRRKQQQTPVAAPPVVVPPRTRAVPVRSESSRIRTESLERTD